MSDREWIVENTWVCTSCSSTNRGRDMKCQRCGNAKDSEEQDIVPDGDAAPEVTDPELLKLANQGEDWVCEYCQARVRDANGKCQNCAAGKALPYNKMDVEATMKIAQALGDPPKEQGNFVNWLIGIGAIALLATVLTIAGIAIFGKHEVELRVTGTSWQYVEELHQRTTVHEEGWGSPSDAFNTSCESKYYGTENCHPHDCRPHQVGYSCHPHQCNAHSVSYSCNCSSYRCNCHTSCTSKRNGFSSCHESCSSCSRCSTCYRTEYSTCTDTCYRTEYDTCYDQCPVYKQYCHYDRYTWPIINRQMTSGSDWQPHWGTLVAGDLQRLDKFETYGVYFQDEKGQRFSYVPRSLAEYRYFNTGHFWKVRTNRAGAVEPVEELKHPPVWR
jgi:hypothetical protein